MKKVIVIGAGASGLMAAYAAAKNGNRVEVIEKNEKAGKKIYITGKGRCNLTNNVEPNDFLLNVVRNARFLSSAIHSFPPSATMALMEEFGTPVKTERGNRVFPVSDHASDVTKALLKACQSVGVSFRFNEKVLSIECMNSTMSDVITEKGRFSADCVIVCTGGLSYPATGSDGDGYRFAKQTGHTVTALTPSLTGINLSGPDAADAAARQGLSLKNVVLTAKKGEKTVYSAFGEMLFTHYGVSGPLVLTLSALLSREKLTDYRLFIDLKPALDEEKLDKRIVRDFSENPNKNLSNALCALLPSSIITGVLSRAGLAAKKPVHSVTKEERSRLVAAVKNFPLHPASLRPFTEAVTTCGGIDVKEINPKTMESKRIKGLYFCGETLDTDAFTGGFNLQIAFSTGYAAGNSIR